MPASSRATSATFELASYRQSIAEAFCGLGRDEQRELVERLAILPRHIHQMAAKGLIAHRLPTGRRKAASSEA